MAEPADINVDELRRRARRRLVGAIVLALGAAVIVPMLLESDPKPLGDDVAVKIPPVDDGKFVNRLNAPQEKIEAPASAAKDVRKETSPQTDLAARKSVAEAEKAVVTPPTRISKYDTAISADKATTSTPVPPAPPPPVTAAPETPPVKSEARSQPDAAATAPVQAVREGFAVQLAAYSDDKGANALANRLKRSGYPAYTEPLKTSRGTLWRVRVGPYPSRDAATGVRDKLKAEGQSGIVASAH
ncbi:MAG TPA: SPOR domain-containing protein [Casimicrobiaceae bacterium]|jgi:DedD protein